MAEHPQKIFMERAIALSEYAGLSKKCGGVFGAVVVQGDRIVGEGYNQVISAKDCTCHAEVEAIRHACKTLNTHQLEGCVLYTSAFCCPMCLCAAYWAHIKTIFYGATIEDTKKYGDFTDVDLYEEMKKGIPQRSLKCQEFMRKEALEGWKKFSQMADRVHY